MKMRSLVAAARVGFISCGLGSTSIVSMRRGLILFFAATILAGCGNDGSTTRSASAARTVDAGSRPESDDTEAQGALRIRTDTQRNRLWVLALGELRVYDTARMRKRLIRTITLPNWSVVGLRHVCMPDMVLDRAGSAFISSNAQAKVWRIDADSFDLKEHDIRFEGKERWDIGFGALAFAADGTLLGRTTPGGWLWKIDIAKASAVMIELNKKLPLDECAFTEQL
jgi:hypothetical protein